jgi:hypothetical protein
VPDDPGTQVIRDIGSWRIVSLYNNSEAFIPDERVKVSSGGTRSFAPGGPGMHSVIPDAKVLNGEGKTVGTTATKDGSPEGGTPILIGGRGELRLSYTPQRKAFAGTLRLSTTSNMQTGLMATIAVDGKPIRTVDVRDSADIDVAELFGPDLAGLRDAKTLVVTAGGDAPYTIYEVEFAETDAALKQMRLVPDYNYNVRRLGRKSEAQEWQDEQNPPAAGQCFLTTACCEIVGLADDCFELASLRRFRDSAMLPDASGRHDVARYYERAPAILAEMRRRGETGRLRGLYFRTILPCAILARLGFARPTRLLYTRMMRRLEARYG